ncbi:MAG: hypothetical protein K9M98_03105 [Cephaloticoccus sp.]|nr:hypothetical protein [Cephaloticoccus sp.]MCF7759470.1 hypothetical protein [Cephaloticoccus sp.]
MAIWEYKVITSGKGGFATPAMLEKFLGDLGKDEWEVIEFHTLPDNPLAFSGLARRSTQRDWTLQDAAASAAKAEADKIRAEFEAKFKGMSASAAPGPVEGEPDAAVEQDDGYRSPVDTSRDLDPDAEDDDGKDEWDQLVQEDELPTFFEAIRPHMRRNQRGAGMSVGVDFLAKKWGFDDADVIGALKECGFEMPEDEDTKAAYLEYDGDLFWVNINRRGELWINTKEKPMPVFRVVPGQPVAVEEDTKAKEKPPTDEPKREDRPKKPESNKPAKAAGAPLPKGEELLSKIRPHMRRSRHGVGHSGSMVFLSRALKSSEADLQAAFIEMGLAMPEKNGDEPVVTEIGEEIWWLNKDPRGAVWINGTEKQTAETEAASATASAGPDDLLTAARPLLKAAKNGAAAELGELAEKLGKPADEIVAALAALGLKAPEKARQKPEYLERAGESFWLSLNAKGQLSLHAKAARGSAPQAKDAPAEGPATAGAKKKARPPRSRKKSEEKPAESPTDTSAEPAAE